MIRVYEPYMTPKASEYLNDCIKSNWISWQGKYIDLCCEKLRGMVQKNHCVLTSNGTTAVHLAVLALFKKNPNINKVVFPSSAYIAAYSPFFMNKELEFDVVLSDVEVETWNPRYRNIDADENTLFVVVHNGGNVVNVPKLRKRYPKSLIFEDNCEGMFGSYENSPTGSVSDISVCSFFANKNVTSGEGGALFVDDRDLYDYVMKLRGQGQSETRFVHDVLGYNYRMTNIQAAVLLSQLEIVDEIMGKKRRIFQKYKENFSSVDGIRIPKSDVNCIGSTWMFGFYFDADSFFERMESKMKMDKIETRPMFYSYSRHGWLQTPVRGKDTNAQKVSEKSIIIPSYPSMNDHDVEYISSCVVKNLGEFKL